VLGLAPVDLLGPLVLTFTNCAFVYALICRQSICHNECCTVADERLNNDMCLALIRDLRQLLLA